MIYTACPKCGERFVVGRLHICEIDQIRAHQFVQERAAFAPLRAHDAHKETNPKDGIGLTKPPMSTVPSTVTHEVGLALLEGACKYRRHNYRVYGVRASVYYDATMRHMNKFWEGEDIDPDSGLSHVTKAIASLFVLRDAMIQDMWHDDRPPMTRPEFWAELEVATKNVLARFPNPKAPHTQVEESKKEATYCSHDDCGGSQACNTGDMRK